MTRRTKFWKENTLPDGLCIFFWCIFAVWCMAETIFRPLFVKGPTKVTRPPTMTSIQLRGIYALHYASLDREYCWAENGNNEEE